MSSLSALPRPSHPVSLLQWLQKDGLTFVLGRELLLDLVEIAAGGTRTRISARASLARSLITHLSASRTLSGRNAAAGVAAAAGVGDGRGEAATGAGAATVAGAGTGDGTDVGGPGSRGRGPPRPVGAGADIPGCRR